MGKQRVLKEKRGQVQIEYIIILGLVLIAVMSLSYVGVTHIANRNKAIGIEESVNALAAKIDNLVLLSSGSRDQVVVSLPKAVTATRVEGKQIALSYVGKGGETVEVVKEIRTQVMGSIPLIVGVQRIRLVKVNETLIFIGQAPFLRELDPECVSGAQVADGAPIAMRGLGFDPSSTVYKDGSPYGYPARPFSVVSEGEMRFTAHAAYTFTGLPLKAMMSVDDGIKYKSNTLPFYVVPNLYQSENCAAVTVSHNNTGLLLHLPFYNNATTTPGAVLDYSSYGRHSTLAAAPETPTWTAAGKTIGGAYEFEYKLLPGNEDRIDVPSFDIEGNEATLMAWINFYTVGDKETRIIAKANGPDTSNQWWTLGLEKKGGKVTSEFILKLSEGVTKSVSGKRTLQPGAWIHIAAVYDGAEMRVYQGCELDNATQGVFGNIAKDIGVPVSVGNTPFGTAGSQLKTFDGLIDEVKVYSYALTLQEIQQSCEAKKSAASLYTALLQNLTTDDLHLSYSLVNFTANPVKAITDWRINSISLAALNMPFDTDTTPTVQDYTTRFGGTGNVQSGVTWESTTCPQGGCYTFDGGGGIGLGAPTTLDMTNKELTIAAWVYPAVKFRRGTVVSRGGTLNTKQFSLFQTGEGNWKCDIWNGTDKLSVVAVGESGVSVDQWQHLGCTWNGTKMTLYKNAQVKRTTTDIGFGGIRQEAGVDQTGIGGDFENNNDFFNGRIDEVLIYDRALSVEQLAIMEQAGKEGPSQEQVKKMSFKETDFGETWTVEVTPTDLINEAKPVFSNTLLIAGSAPPF